MEVGQPGQPGDLPVDGREASLSQYYAPLPSIAPCHGTPLSHMMPLSTAHRRPATHVTDVTAMSQAQPKRGVFQYHGVT